MYFLIAKPVMEVAQRGIPNSMGNRNDVIRRTGLKTSNKPELVIEGISCIQSQTFINDAAKVWNEAPAIMKECKTIITAKNT